MAAKAKAHNWRLGLGEPSSHHKILCTFQKFWLERTWGPTSKFTNCVIHRIKLHPFNDDNFIFTTYLPNVSPTKFPILRRFVWCSRQQQNSTCWIFSSRLPFTSSVRSIKPLISTCTCKWLLLAIWSRWKSEILLSRSWKQMGLLLRWERATRKAVLIFKVNTEALFLLQEFWRCFLNHSGHLSVSANFLICMVCMYFH